VEQAVDTAKKILAPDPKQAEKDLHAVTHGIDHFFKEIDHVAKKHGKELAIKGRITACSQTACLSEIYRDYELKKARAEAQKQKEEMLRNARAQLEDDLKSGHLSSLKQMRQSLSDQLAEANELDREYEADIRMLQSYFEVLIGERQNRASLRKMGRPLPAATVNVADLVQQTSALLNASPNSEAMEKLEALIAARAQQIGVDITALNAEILKSISDADLDNLIQKVDADAKNKVELQAQLFADTAELQAQFDIADANIKKIETKK
jgi:hypothetical protein